MATFILVHGAWHGGWCWQRVRDLLQDQGHRVFTPTLTGLADRSHLLSPQVNLGTHIDDVVNLIRWEGLTDVVLCGHSYGGAVITGVADRAFDRIASMVYLDAYILENGQNIQDATDPATMAAFLELARTTGGGWTVPPPAAALFGVEEADQAWVDGLCTPQPLACLTQPLELRSDLAGIRKSYIHATAQETAPAFMPFFAAAQAKAWDVSTIDCGHDIMLDRPVELSRMLVAAASGT